MKRYELEKYQIANEDDLIWDFLTEKKLTKDYLKWRDEDLSKPQASELPLRAGICPKNHGIARQLSTEGYCADCLDYPYGRGKNHP